MSGVMWGALAQMPNPGQAFADSFNQGMERNRQQEQEWLKYIGTVAAWAETPEQWDQAVDYFVQSGYKAAEQFRGKFEMRVPLMARAGITPPKSQGTDDITEYQLAVKQGFQGSFMDFKQQQRGPQLVSGPEGGFVAAVGPDGKPKMLIAPNPGNVAPGTPVQSGPPPAAAIARLRQNPHEASQFDEIFGPGAAQSVLGGAGGNASGGFRDPLAPL